MTAISLNIAMLCLEEFIAEDIATFVWGPPGVGKSDTVRYIAKRKKNWGLIDIRLSLRDPVDLRGLPMVDAKTGLTRWLTPAELPDIVRHGKNGILFIDECNHASQQMQSAAMSLVHDRCIGEYKLPSGWVPIAAGNRLIDKAGTNRMGTALRNRFAHIEIALDHDSWYDWALRVGLNVKVIAFIKFRPELLHMMPEGDVNSFPTPRMWEKVAKFAEKPETIRQTLVASLVGDGPASEFEAFLRIWTKLPSLKRILAGEKERVPDMSEPALFFALSSLLAKNVTKDTFGNAISYMQRWPDADFQINTVIEAVKRDRDLTKTKAYANWAAKNSQVLI